jgi:hypothetical protein
VRALAEEFAFTLHLRTRGEKLREKATVVLMMGLSF